MSSGARDVVSTRTGIEGLPDHYHVVWVVFDEQDNGPLPEAAWHLRASLARSIRIRRSEAIIIPALPGGQAAGAVPHDVWRSAMGYEQGGSASGGRQGNGR